MSSNNFTFYAEPHIIDDLAIGVGETRDGREYIDISLPTSDGRGFSSMLLTLNQARVLRDCLNGCIEALEIDDEDRS